MSSATSLPRSKPPRIKKKPPGYLPSKKPRAKKYPKMEDINPELEHTLLKSYLLTRKLMVERSMNPTVRSEAGRIDRFLVYLRSLE